AQKLTDDINASNAGQTLVLTAEVIDGSRVLVRSNLDNTRAEVSTKTALQEFSFTIPDGTGTDPDLSNLTFAFTLEVFDSLANSMGTTVPVTYDPALGAAGSAGALETALDQLAGVPNGFIVSEGGASTATNPIWDITYPAGNDYAALGINFPTVNAFTGNVTTPGPGTSEQQRLYFQPTPAVLDYQFQITVTLPDPGNPDIVGTTGPIDWDATPAEVTAALDAMATATTGLTPGYAVAGGVPTGGASLAQPWLITFPLELDYSPLIVAEISRSPELQANVMVTQGGDFGPTASGITGVVPGRIAIEFEPSSFWRTQQVSDAIVDAINNEGPLEVTAELKDFTTSHVRLNHDTQSNWEIVVCLNNPTYQPMPAPFPPSPPPTNNPDDNLCYYDPGFLPGGASSGTITTEANGPLKTYAADIDGDGDQDVVSSQFLDNTVRWYENNGTGSFTGHLVSDNVDYAAGVHGADFDGDGDQDIVSASMGDDTIYWHENHINWFQLGSDINGTTPLDESGTVTSLSSDGLTVAIGEPSNDANGLNSGRTRVLRYDTAAETWNLLGAPLLGESIGNISGSSLALSGDGNTVVIGAPNNDGGGVGLQTGHARIYRYNATTDVWNLVGDIDGQAGGDEFGWSVGISEDGDIVSIGAQHHDAGGNLNSGQVRSYRYNAATTNWDDHGTPIDGAAISDEFGISLSMTADGKTLAVGSHLHDAAGTDRGQVRIFAHNVATDTWDPVGNAIDGQEDGEHFGFAVSLDDAGTRIAVGADLNDAGGTDRGRVQIFEYNGTTTWNQMGSDIDGQVDLDQLGYAVSLSGVGDSVAIGTFGDDTVGGESGQTRIYDFDTGLFTPDWVQRGIDLDGEAAADESGRSVSMSGDGTRVAIGAPQNSTAAGHTRVYEYGRQFAQHVISTNADQARSVFAVDVDGNGTTDVISASREDDKIAWYSNDGLGNFGPQQIISTNADQTHAVFAVDLDSDGDMDVLATARGTDTVYWYENDG
ncbi:MAG: VCBS repeat-containing protein, partial [Pirellulaceae bacterium]